MAKARFHQSIIAAQAKCEARADFTIPRLRFGIFGDGCPGARRRRQFGQLRSPRLPLWHPMKAQFTRPFGSQHRSSAHSTPPPVRPAPRSEMTMSDMAVGAGHLLPAGHCVATSLNLNKWRLQHKRIGGLWYPPLGLCELGSFSFFVSWVGAPSCPAARNCRGACFSH